MIHEILEILDTTDLQELEKQRITTNLLRLFRERVASYMQDVIGKKYSIYFEEEDIYGLI